MSYMIRFRSNRDVEEYKEAGKKAKDGIEMIMDAVENNDKRMIVEGAEMAFKGVKKMCEISEEMEQQYGERRNDEMQPMDGGMDMMENRRGNYNNRGNYGNRQWNQRDTEWMERRMRDARGRFA